MANVIIQGEFIVNPEDRDRFLELSADGIRHSRSEDGCLEFLFAADPIEPGRVIISERWESKAHLDAHLAGMQSNPDPNAATRPKPLKLNLTAYEVAGTIKLG